MYNQRAFIVKIFIDILIRGKTLEDALSLHKMENDAFVKAHVYGLCRWYFQLDNIAKQLLNKRPKEKDNDIYVLILLGLHQIFHSEIKEHALVSETVAVADILKKTWAKGLINACLRRALREKESFSQMDLYSHPAWMIDHIKQSWPHHWEKIIENNNHQGPMTLRINRKREHELPILKEWLSEFARPQQQRLSSCVYLKSPLPVQSIPGFNEGIVSVQDEASQYAATLLSLKPNEYVLDACSAPGGKTGHLLEIEANIHLTAADISETRLNKVKENLKRLKLDQHVTFKVGDVSKENWPADYFDKILLDAPCSGTGVIRRHPDIKLLRRMSDLAYFSEQQMRLLDHLWPALKVNGYLLYTTCSIMPEENEKLIHAFLKKHKDAGVKAIHLPINGAIFDLGCQVFPQEDEADGFYYNLLFKKKITPGGLSAPFSLSLGPG